jgi:hypothetical protein
MTFRDRRLRRDRILRIVGLGLLLIALSLPDHLGWAWSANYTEAAGTTASAAWEEIVRGMRGISGSAGAFWAAPLALLPGWILVTARPPRSADGRRILRGWFIAGAGVIILIGITGPHFAAGSLPWPAATDMAAVAWIAAAVVAAFPPRRRRRLDPAPWAAAQALACALPWTILVLDTAIHARLESPEEGFLRVLNENSCDHLHLGESYSWRLLWWFVPGTFLLWAGLLLFALPSYLPRRRRRDRLGAPTLAAPAAGSTAP